MDPYASSYYDPGFSPLYPEHVPTTTLNFSLRISQSFHSPDSSFQAPESKKVAKTIDHQEKGVKRKRTDSLEEERPRKISRVPSDLRKSEEIKKEPTHFLTSSFGVPFQGESYGVQHQYDPFEYSFIEDLRNEEQHEEGSFDYPMKPIKQEQFFESGTEVKSLKEEEKHVQRKEKNRAYAQTSREKKKIRLKELEGTEGALVSIGLNVELSLDTYYQTFPDSEVEPLFSDTTKKLTFKEKLERYKTHLSQLFFEITNEAIKTQQKNYELEFVLIAQQAEIQRLRDLTTSTSDI